MRRATTGAAVLAAVLALAVAALAAPDARASSPRPDDSPAYEVRTCKGESAALTAPEYESLAMHNEAREEAGLPHLCVNPTLTRAARGHAADMLERDYFAHDTPEGAEPIDRMMDAGYSGFNVSGENIAYGTGPLADSEPIFDSLMESPGHRANILRGAFLEVCVGAVGSEGGSASSTGMYAMDFGARPAQPHEYPELLTSTEGQATTPPDAPPSHDQLTRATQETADGPAAEAPAAESGQEESDLRQEILCELLAKTDVAAFADDLGWALPESPGCGRTGDAP